MFERINEIIAKIEEIRDEIQILLGMGKIDFVDYIMIKRGSMDMPEELQMSVLEQLNEQVDRLKEQIDRLNKIKREMLVF
ncbi:hypothetical protein BKN38_06105 [Helicobacter sp. CLO-3]|uniref:DUF2443 family protein n=1 Tax=unclassified Helicobacter TaxID=2593540 RepID=UPI000804DD40|nr:MULTISPECIES: DUF2443 family protein [unclassified Helicobacter]OBV29116.1 hypothetical protein BA723_06845 [Helicobacter sp. CLO-3]OHU82928.1 hypothetical protein BKN38_06105 [Helicobacter sp. CLO-3]